MNRKSMIAGTALIAALAGLIAAPVWLGATEPADENATARPAHGFLGVGLRDLTPELQTHFGAPAGSGVLVATVSDDSPAAAAGIAVGDVITAIDGLAVDSRRALSREVRHRPGDSVAVEIYRDGKQRRVTATLGEHETRSRGHFPEHAGRSPEEWAEFAERWARWGEEFGERWGEEFAERWGEEHAESWQRWAEEMAERGEGWEEMGEEIGKTVARALSEIDWDQIGKTVEESLEAIEAADWEGMSEDVERRVQELERRLEDQDEPAPGNE